MSQSSQTPEPSKSKQAVNNVALFSVGAQVGCVTLIIVLLSVFIGIGLDKLLGTQPLFIILFVLGSAPISIYVTYLLAMRAVKSSIPQASEAKQAKPAEEEQKRE
jgi:F0F1-type ATP synthase assembly protein I